MKKLKGLFLTVLLSILVITPGLTLANTKNTPSSPNITNNNTFNAFVKKTGYQDPTQSSRTLPEVIGAVVQNILELVGIIFALLIIYGGIRWMTAGGDSGRVDKAKNIIINSVIGIIITLGAYAISYGVIEIILKSTTN